MIPANVDPLAMINQDNDFAGITIYLLEDDYQTDENGDQLKLLFH